MNRALLDVAVTLADEAGRIATERFFADDLDIAVKRDGSEVTDADVAVERMLRAELRRRFPGDEIYGEEAGVTAGLPCR